MQWLTLHDDKSITLNSCFDYIEISFNDKTYHFQILHKKTGIPYKNMVFFDNEHSNIKCVEKLGVKCVYTPNGMTRDAWAKALGMFDG